MYKDHLALIPSHSLLLKTVLIQIPRPCDKKKVLFYYDHTTDLDLGDISHENSKCVENLMQNVIQYQLGKSSLFLECGYDE